MPSLSQSVESTTWFHQRPSHRKVPANVTQAQFDEDRAWQYVEEITDQVAFARIMGDDEALEDAYRKYDGALKLAKMASTRVYEIKRENGNG